MILPIKTLRRIALILSISVIAIVSVELTRPMREGLSLVVIEGVDQSYDGKYATNAAYLKLLQSSPHIVARALENIEQRVGLKPTRPDRLIVRFKDGLQPNQPVALRRTRHVNGHKSQLLTFMLEPILLETVNFQTVLTHELVHAIMRQHMGSRYLQLPQWLRESFATWGASQLQEKTSVLIAGKIYAHQDPRSLIQGFKGVPHTLDAYLEEALLMEYIATEYGPDRISRLLKQIIEGENHGNAIRRLCGVGWDGLQKLSMAFSIDYVDNQLTIAGFSAYEQAEQEYYRQNFDHSISEFREFIQLYPESFLKANAIFFIGESQFALERYSNAYAAFQTVGDDHPIYFYLIDDAQYRLIETLINMERKEEAVQALESFINNFTFANEPYTLAVKQYLNMLLGDR